MRTKKLRFPDEKKLSGFCLLNKHIYNQFHKIFKIYHLFIFAPLSCNYFLSDHMFQYIGILRSIILIPDVQLRKKTIKAFLCINVMHIHVTWRCVSIDSSHLMQDTLRGAAYRCRVITGEHVRRPHYDVTVKQRNGLSQKTEVI